MAASVQHIRRYGGENEEEKHQIRRDRMKEYPKIEAVYQRDTTGSKKLIEGRFRNETVRFLKDCDWICTEKIDGTNISICWNGHKVTYNGRTERASIPAHLMNVLVDMFGGDENEELFEQKFGDTSVILYGEGYGPKIQNGGQYREDPSFILFDVYLPAQDLWLKRDAVEDIARCFKIDVVPIIMRGTIQEAVDFVKSHPKSTIGTADMEGLVCKPAVDMFDCMKKRVIVKVKVKDFM